MIRGAIFILVMTTVMSAQSIDRLRTLVESEFRSVPGTFALAMENLTTEERLLVNEREMFHAASTMKTPVMIEIFRQARAGKFRLQDSLQVKNEFRSLVDGSPFSLNIKDDSDDSMYALVGRNVSILDLITHMITASSNLATNMMVDLAGPATVTATMRALGADSIKVIRGVEDGKAFEKGLNNVTNAYDLMLIFKALALGRAADTASCSEMIGILSRQTFRDKIPALLPKEVRVANKTGNINGVEHDSAILFLPGGRKYVLVVLSKNLKNNDDGKKVIARVSKLIYDSVVHESIR